MTISFILGDTGVIPPALEIADEAFSTASIDFDCTTSDYSHAKINLPVQELEFDLEADGNVADKSYNVNENEILVDNFELNDWEQRIDFTVTVDGNGKVVMIGSEIGFMIVKIELKFVCVE